MSKQIEQPTAETSQPDNRELEAVYINNPTLQSGGCIIQNEPLTEDDDSASGFRPRAPAPDADADFEVPRDGLPSGYGPGYLQDTKRAARMTTEERDEFYEEVRSGILTVTAAARKWGISRQYAHRLLHHIEEKQLGSLGPAAMGRIALYMARGGTAKEASEKFRVHLRTVFHIANTAMAMGAHRWLRGIR